jgi:hypothetical protein
MQASRLNMRPHAGKFFKHINKKSTDAVFWSVILITNAWICVKMPLLPMVLSVFKVLVYQLLGGIFRCRPGPFGHQPTFIRRIFFAELLERLESIELAGAPRRSASTFVGGPKTTPIRSMTVARVAITARTLGLHDQRALEGESASDIRRSIQRLNQRRLAGVLGFTEARGSPPWPTSFQAPRASDGQ